MLVPLDRWHLKVKLSLALKSKGHLSFLSEPVGKSMPGNECHLRIRRVDVVNGNSALNTSQSKTCRLVLFVFKNSHTSMLWLK